MRYVLFYEPVPDVLDRAGAHMDRHLAVVHELHDRGEILGVGTFADPVRDGAMTILRSREAAEEMVRRDPFVTEGLVARWTIKEWDDIYSR